MSGKIHPKKPVSHAVGPVYTTNDSAKFKGPGKTSGKTMSNGVVEEKVGPVFTENSTHIPTMNADKPAPATKILTSGKDEKFNPMKSKVNLVSQRTASAKGGESTPSYPLKKEYRK